MFHPYRINWLDIKELWKTAYSKIKMEKYKRRNSKEETQKKKLKEETQKRKLKKKQ